MRCAALLTMAALLSWGEPGPPGHPWREIRYADRTRYTVAVAEGDTLLRAASHDQNSALVYERRIDPRGARLSWRWRVLQHPEGADPERRALDDRAAAVIVIVRRSIFPWRTRALLYQWAPARPRGEWSESPYSREVKTLVLENASADALWREEERDLAADLERAFGALPDHIQAIGVFCDTDNTGGRAAAEFGALRISLGGAAHAPARPDSSK